MLFLFLKGPLATLTGKKREKNTVLHSFLT